MKSNLFLILRRSWILATHVAMIAFSLAASFLLRFDFSIPPSEVRQLVMGLAIAVPLKMLIFLAARLDRGWWKLVGIHDLTRVLIANMAGSALFATTAAVVVGRSFARSVYIIDFIVCFLTTAGLRFAVRLYNELVLGQFGEPSNNNLLIYGAGQAAFTLIRELRTNRNLGRVVGLIDDDPEKRRLILLGVPVLGCGRDVVRIVDRLKRKDVKISEVVVAIPSATSRQLRDALANVRAAGLRCKIIPGVRDLLAGKGLSAQIRELSLEDLLGREPVQLEEDRIRTHIATKSVLVTGGGGSIGSELCRQIARFGPVKLIVLDQAESDLYRIDLELRKSCPSLSITPVIADIRDAERVAEVMRTYQIDAVFHAAAYKHVPMMEAHVHEAVKNNVLGTWNVVSAAYKQRVSHFLMISSDKAVNPANIMGITKRIAELIVASMPLSAGATKFTSVRFGNVLGSNGSVVPLFKEQIAAGGPVTVTHPDIRRYFMTIPEAVQLVLQASTMGKGSEIFALEMGEPVPIVDLARNMIRLSGYEPDVDIEIRFTGLRPGEKLYEEVMGDKEHHAETYHPKIRVFQGPHPTLSVIEKWLRDLRVLLEQPNEQNLVAHMCQLVPEYTPKKRASEPSRVAVAATGD